MCGHMIRRCLHCKAAVPLTLIDQMNASHYILKLSMIECIIRRLCSGSNGWPLYSFKKMSPNTVRLVIYWCLAVWRASKDHRPTLRVPMFFFIFLCFLSFSTLTLFLAVAGINRLYILCKLRSYGHIVIAAEMTACVMFLWSMVLFNVRCKKHLLINHKCPKTILIYNVPVFDHLRIDTSYSTTLGARLGWSLGALLDLRFPFKPPWLTSWVTGHL